MSNSRKLLLLEVLLLIVLPATATALLVSHEQVTPMPKETQDFVMPHGLSVDVPHMADYFGVWNIEPGYFSQIVERCNGINLHAHVATQQPVQTSRQPAFQVTEDGIAIFRVEGATMKRTSSLSGGTSTIQLRQQLRAARKDESIIGAMLVMDTPGGTVKGNLDLAEEVASFAAAKPIYAFTEDMTASAGVSVASQATRRYANNATALYGGMGTYSVLVDASGMAEKLGVKVHVVRAGEHKGAGEPGTPIDAKQLAEAQRIVNALNEAYLGMIAKGLDKNIEAIRPLADGRVHTAADAAVMGLIDGVQSYDATYDQLVAESKQRQISNEEQTQMSKEQEKPQAATLAELKRTFPNSSADWRESQIEAGATLPEAAVAYAAHVEEQAKKEKAELQKQLEEAQKKTATPPKSVGLSPVTMIDAHGEFAGDSGDPIEDFDAAVARLAGGNPTWESRNAAIRAVAKANPDLHRAYLLATNPGKLQARLIGEKMPA